MLVFDNGTVSWDELAVPPTFNESGDIEASEKHEMSARCNISILSENKKDYEDGKAESATYLVTIDMESVPNVSTNASGQLSATYIKLQHDRKGCLGVFPIQRIEYYEITQSIGIWV